MPGTLLLVAVNLIPVLGVVFWSWDAFELLVLYWCETAIVAFWTIVRLGLAPQTGPRPRPMAKRLVRALFFALTILVFMCVHLAILWTVFSGDWAGRVHTAADFVDQLLIRNGAWLPLAVTFLVNGVLMLLDIAAGKGAGGSPLRDLYGRIVTLQVTLILGGLLATFIGGRTTLILLVAIRIMIELFTNSATGKRRAAAA
jgi:hypothetical protein